MVLTLGTILPIVLGYLPSLIKIAEGLFSWKEKSGPDKKAFVESTLETVVNGIAASSTGGQKETWDKIKPGVSTAIDGLVEIANNVGMFDEVSQTGLAGG
jgi:hypothetical protein